MPSPVLMAYSDWGTEPDILLEPDAADTTIDAGALQKLGLGGSDGAHITPPLQTDPLPPFQAFLQALAKTEKKETPCAQGSSADGPPFVPEDGVVQTPDLCFK